MDFAWIIEAITASGLADKVSNLVEENKDQVDNIEEYVVDMVKNIILGNDKAAYKKYKKLKKPYDKLSAARGLINKARAEKKKYDEFKDS